MAAIQASQVMSGPADLKALRSPKALNGMCVRYRGKKSWSQGLRNVSILLLIIALFILGLKMTTRGAPEGLWTVGTCLFVASLGGLFAATRMAQASPKGRKFEGLVVLDDQVCVGNLRMVYKNEQLVSIEREDTCLMKILPPKAVEIKVNLLFSGNYLLNKIRLVSREDDTEIMELSYNPFASLREKECIRLIKMGKFISTDTIFKEKIIDFIEPIEEIAKSLFSASDVKLSLDVVVNQANYARNAAFFGLLGIIFSGISDVIQRRTAVRDFLNGEITLKNGLKFGDYCDEHKWEVNLIQ